MSIIRSAIRTITQLAVAAALVSTPGLSAAGQLIGDTVPKLNGTALVRELKKGGYVIYFRHGATADTREKDVADADLDNCELQRPLSNEGRVQTKLIGDAFRKLQIPVGQAYSSPYCRCLETATNIFGKAEKSRALHFAIQLRLTDRARVTVQLLDMLGTVPKAGTNTGMVSHTANLQEAVGIWPKPEGVAHIFKPGPDGQFTYVGTMPAEAWQEEAARATGRPGWFPSMPQWVGGDK